MSINVAVPGIGDPARLIQWLGANDGPGTRLRGIELISGGRSNLTYRLDFEPAGGGAPAEPMVLRRPPLGHVLPTAHDMGREYRVLAALHGTAVPVPEPVALCRDESVIGAPFYLMRYVHGVVLRTQQDGDQLTPGRAGQICEQLAQTLAAIHAVDVAAVGLAGFGRPDGYLARQLARWQRQWELSAAAVGRPTPEFHRLAGRLTQRMPAASEGTLVHGDFRLDNLLIVVGPAPRVAAVVDWEMSTLGDPLADLGLTLAYWTDPGDTQRLGLELAGAVTSRPGFLTGAAFASRYGELTGRDVSGIGYYVAFGCFKLAVVLEGIHARFLQHKTVGDGFAGAGTAVPVLIGRAHEMLDSLS
jgi:aminoglycoside phosphotransferase (APT) family kinase protein